MVGRFGGDEFCVLLPSGTTDDARAVAIDAVRRLESAGGERISCGVAARTEALEAPTEPLRAADEAQYRAKRARDAEHVVTAGDEDAEPPRRRGTTAPTARATRTRPWPRAART